MHISAVADDHRTLAPILRSASAFLASRAHAHRSPLPPSPRLLSLPLGAAAFASPPSCRFSFFPATAPFAPPLAAAAAAAAKHSCSSGRERPPVQCAAHALVERRRPHPFSSCLWFSAYCLVFSTLFLLASARPFCREKYQTLMSKQQFKQQQPLSPSFARRAFTKARKKREKSRSAIQSGAPRCLDRTTAAAARDVCVWSEGWWQSLVEKQAIALAATKAEWSRSCSRERRGCVCVCCCHGGISVSVLTVSCVCVSVVCRRGC